MKKIAKPMAVMVIALILIFSAISFFGIGRKWGDSKIYTFKGAETINFGKDLGVGNEVVLKPNSQDFETQKQMGGVISTLKRRLNNLELSDNDITTDMDENALVVEFSDPANDKGYNPNLTCNLLGQKSEITIKTTPNRMAFMQMDFNNMPKSETIIENEDIKSAKLINEKINKLAPLKYKVELSLTQEGVNKLNDYIEKVNKKKEETSEEEKKKNPESDNLQVLLDQAPIAIIKADELKASENLTIYNNSWALAHIKQVVSLIDGGNLITQFSPTEIKTLTPTLGFGIKKSIFTTLIALFILILVLLIVKYRLVGAISSIALIGHVSGVIATLTGFFSFFHGISLTLPVLGGILVGLFVGFSSIILVAVKISQKLKANKNIDMAIAEGYSETLKSVSGLVVKITILSVIAMAIFFVPNSMMRYVCPWVSYLSPCPNVAISSFGLAALIGMILVMFFEFLCSKFILKSIAGYENLRNVKLYGGVK